MAIIAKESGFSPAPTGDHGPMQLSGWLRSYNSRNNLGLILPGAYHPFGRPRDHPNRNREFTGDYDANVVTGANWIRYQRNELRKSDWQIAHGWGPGGAPGIRDAYARDASTLREMYFKFLNCLQTGQ